MIASTHQASPFIRYSSGAVESRSAMIAIENEVTLSVNGGEWLSFRCSPENLEGLAAGYLFNESIIQAKEEIASIHICAQGELVDLWLQHAVEKPETWSRTSGCMGGLTQSRPAAVHPVDAPSSYSVPDILGMIDNFLTLINKPDFPQHGVHTTLLADNYQVVSLCNDIGRHNTLDKIAGDCLLRSIKLSSPMLITTGRISSEMVYKAARMEIPLAISLHSISQLAIQAAEPLGITLAGHARRSQIDIYSHPERILAKVHA